MVDTSTLDPWAAPIPVGTPGGRVFPRAMVTGHRPKHLTAAEQAWSQVALHRAAWRLRSVYGTVHGISGLALGADTWWAMAVLASGMDLHAYIPFEAQSATWPAADQAVWHELRRRASSVTVVSDGGYDVRALHARNEAMLADADLVVALYKDGTPGGTASAIAKARRRGQPILLLDPTAQKMRRQGW